MKITGSILIVLLAFTFAFANNNEEVLEFKTKIGFVNEEDKIITHRFLEDGSKVLIIGEKTLQLWDIESAKLINSIPHDLSQFAPQGFFSKYFLLGLPRLIRWEPFIVEPSGKWIATIEKIGNSQIDSAVVRNLKDLKQLAVLSLPNISTDYIAFDDQKNEILTFGNEDLDTAFASWNKDDFTQKDLVAVKDYKWHQMIENGEKILVGSGDTKFSWSAIMNKQGDTLTLRDVKTGGIEKQFTAENLEINTSFQNTTVSPDDKFLISERDDRLFVWEIEGDGKPKFEVSQADPKRDFDFKRIADQRYIVTKVDEQIRIFDAAGDGTPFFKLEPKKSKEDLDFKEIINDRFVVVKAENNLRVYDTQGGQSLKYELASADPDDTMQFVGTPKDGKYLVVRNDSKVSVFDLEGGDKPLYEIVRNSKSERFNFVFFRSDKDLLAVSRANRKEKMPPRTEFYDIATGKIKLTAPFEAHYGVMFTPDEKYLYQENLGAFSVWNIASDKFYVLELDTDEEPIYEPGSVESNDTREVNSEYVKFSPDYRYLLRYGDNVTAIFEAETGKQVQAIYDPKKVKYDKRKQVKKSGLGEAGWLENGEYVYAFEPLKLFSNQRTISLWKVKK